MCVVSKFSLGQCPCLLLLELNFKLKMTQFCVIEPELGRHTLQHPRVNYQKFCLWASCHDLPGRYSSLAALIWISVSAAICSFWVTSSAVRLVLPRTRIRLSSSTSEPYKETYFWVSQKMNNNTNITHGITMVMEFRNKTRGCYRCMCFYYSFIGWPHLCNFLS